jgi:hypothetical protein
VVSLFVSAVASFGLPSRVRSDMGMENVDIAKYMLHHPERYTTRELNVSGWRLRKTSYYTTKTFFTT